MKLSSAPFTKILRGEKTIEVRLNDPKRQILKLGDDIEFSENEHPEHRMLARIEELLYYPTFEALYSNHDLVLFGGESKEFLLQAIRRFYSPADEARYGVVGIRIRLIDDSHKSR